MLSPVITRYHSLSPHRKNNAPTFTFKLNREGSVSSAPVAYLYINSGYTEACIYRFYFLKTKSSKKDDADCSHRLLRGIMYAHVFTF